MNLHEWRTGWRVLERRSRWIAVAMAAWGCAPAAPHAEAGRDSTESAEGDSGASLQVSPTELTFPDTAVGSAAEPQQLTITNHAPIDVTLGAPALYGGTAFSLGEVEASALQLAPGGALTVTVGFAPEESGRRGDQVTFSGVDGEEPIVVELWGEGVAPQAWLNPSIYDFGDVALSSEPSIEVQLLNGGNASLRLVSVAFNGAGFVLLKPDILASKVGSELLPGQELRIGVGVAPDAVGEVAASLEVTTDDPVRPTVSTDLSANVVTRAR